MRQTFPIIWAFLGATHTGRFELIGDRLELSGRGSTLGFSLDQVTGYVVERGPARRLRGLPVLALQLAGGSTVAVASVGGVGTLHDLVTLVVDRLSQIESVSGT
jgi:hypothetical protein